MKHRFPQEFLISLTVMARQWERTSQRTLGLT